MSDRGQSMWRRSRKRRAFDRKEQEMRKRKKTKGPDFVYEGVEPGSSSAGGGRRGNGPRTLTYDLATTIRPSARRRAHFAVQPALVGSWEGRTAAGRRLSERPLLPQPCNNTLSSRQFQHILLVCLFISGLHLARHHRRWVSKLDTQQPRHGRMIPITTQPRAGGDNDDHNQLVGGDKRAGIP